MLGFGRGALSGGPMPKSWTRGFWAIQAFCWTWLAPLYEISSRLLRMPSLPRPRASFTRQGTRVGMSSLRPEKVVWLVDRMTLQLFHVSVVVLVWWVLLFCLVVLVVVV